MEYYCNPYELYHHGILGMKWGVRRWQNKDGSLTPAGRKRYNVDISGAQEKLKLAKKDYKRHKSSKTKREFEWAKNDLASEKAKEKINQETGVKSKHRLKLEEEYRNRGFTEEEAEIAAYKRARTEKILAAAIGVTVAATAAYVAYKHYDKVTDKILKPGTLLQNISTNSNKGVEDAFYASYVDKDKVKYKGMFADYLRTSKGTDIYNTEIGVKKNLKIASEKNATKVLADLVKTDANYAKKLEEYMQDTANTKSHFGSNKTFNKGLQMLKKGKVDHNTWEAFNRLLEFHTPTAQEVNQGFYDKLKSAGYDAILDVEDMRYTGYNSSRPIIIFNGKDKTNVKSISKLGADEIHKNLMTSYKDIYNKERNTALVKTGAALVGSLLVGKAINIAKNKKNERQNDEIVREYRKKHPNTNLSYTEIVRMKQSNKIKGDTYG